MVGGNSLGRIPRPLAIVLAALGVGVLAAAILVFLSAGAAPAAAETTSPFTNGKTYTVKYANDAENAGMVEGYAGSYLFCIQHHVATMEGEATAGELLGTAHSGLSSQFNSATSGASHKWTQDELTWAALGISHIFDTYAQTRGQTYALGVCEGYVWHIDAGALTTSPRWGESDEQIVQEVGNRGVSITTATLDEVDAYVKANAYRYVGHGQRFNHGSSQDTAYFWLTPASGYAQVVKSSALSQVVKGNNCYSLEGAVFGVYSDAACTKKAGSLTTRADGSTSTLELSPGTYYVKETKAPCGYLADAETHRLVVNAGETTQLKVRDVPATDGSWVLVRKLDASLGATPQGNATLAGAVFEVRYFDNTDGSTAGDPLKTWRFKTNAEGYVAFDDESCLVSGDEPYQDANGGTVMPLGTYEIREVEAPEGYTLSDSQAHVSVATLSDEGVVSWEDLDGWGHAGTDVRSGGRFAADEVIRGDVLVGKVDAELDLHLPLGAATLGGATFEIENASTHPVVVDGKTYEPGSVVLTITSDEQGIARTSGGTLPFGSYVVRETGAPQGYLLNETWSQAFDIKAEGQVADLTDSAASADDQVAREDLSLRKKDAQTMEPLAGVAFLVVAESDADGDGVHEAHVTVTDENGILDTSLISPARRDNANDGAVSGVVIGTSDEGLLTVDVSAAQVDEELLDSSYGIWFSGRTDVATSQVSGLASLPYDSYLVVELPTEANANRELVSFEVHLTAGAAAHGRSVDLGTVDDAPAPSIQTTASTDAGSRILVAGSGAHITDNVGYEGLEPGRTYVLEGSLHDASTGEAILDADGDAVTSSVSFRALASSGTQDVNFDFDGTSLSESTKVVVFERLLLDGATVARHEDVNDEWQTVTVEASITTRAFGPDGLTGLAAADDGQELVDVISYTGLIPGESYLATGRLMVRPEDGDGEQPLADADGNTWEIQVNFVPENPTGEVEVPFTCDLDDMAGRTLVVFEEVSRDGTVVASHEDIASESQSVRVPKMGTSAQDGATHTHEAPASESCTIVDTVTYENLVPGEKYELAGSLNLIDGDGGGSTPLASDDGTPITATASLVPTEASGSCEVSFTFDASQLAGRKLVVFEELRHGGVVIARHASEDDAGQTITFPEIRTSAASPKGDKTIAAREGQQVVDTVSYENLVAGSRYVLEGRLVDKDGSTVSEVATYEFTPEEGSGVIELSLLLDGNTLPGQKVVAFERLLDAEGNVVATHEDLSDEGQTVTVSEKEGAKGGSSILPQTGAGAPWLFLLALGAGCHLLSRHLARHAPQP